MALGDIAAGLPWPVFACGDNKQPVVPTGFKAATRERGAIMQQFRSPGAQMIGVPTGAASGLIVVDVDVKDGHDGRPWLDENAEALPPTRTHKTKSGGLHLLFVRPDGYEIRNSASMIAPGIDVRGEGGYIIVPPSPGYAVADTTDPADMPLWLIRACMRPEQPLVPPRRTQERHERYTQVAIDGEVAAVMRAANGTRNDTLNKAAVKLGSLVAAGQMTRGLAETELQHAGQAAGLDASECAKTIKSGLDFGVQHPRAMPAPKLNGHHYHHEDTAPAPPQEIDDAGYWQSVEADAPAPTGDAPKVFDPWNTMRPVSFPIEVLPRALQTFVANRATTIGVDPCAIAWSCISACSAAIDGRVRLQVKRYDTWAVPPAIWVALIGAPSTKKTPAIDVAWSPLHRIQARDIGHQQRAVAEWKSMPKEERARIPEPPPPRRLVSHDATMEAIQDILTKQDRGIGVLRDELAGWIGSMEKYAGAKGGAADRAFALQSYNGGSHVVDRVMRGTMPINNLLTVMCGGIQPDRMRQFGDLTDDGLWQRFVPVIVAPGSMGQDDEPEDSGGYAAIIDDLLHVNPAARIYLCNEAHDIREDVQRRIFALEQTEVLGSRFVGFCGKMVGLWARLTLVLHLIAEPRSEVVRETTADAARTLLFRSVLPNAARVYTAMGGAGADLEATQSIAGYILTKRIARIVMSDLTSNVRVCRGRSLEDVRKLLSPLEAGGWLMPEKDFQPTSWLVADQVHERFAAQAEKESIRRAAVRDLLLGQVRQECQE